MRIRPAELIDRLGGAGQLSQRLRLPSSTVWNWYKRNSIPARYHQAVLNVAEGKVTADEVVAAHAPTARRA